MDWIELIMHCMCIVFCASYLCIIDIVAIGCVKNSVVSFALVVYFHYPFAAIRFQLNSVEKSKICKQ